MLTITSGNYTEYDLQISKEESIMAGLESLIARLKVYHELKWYQAIKKALCVLSVQKDLELLRSNFYEDFVNPQQQ